MFDLLEGLVDGPEPADIRARSEHEDPDDGHAKVCHTTSTKHPSKAAKKIHNKCGTVNCKNTTTTTTKKSSIDAKEKALKNTCLIHKHA